MLRDLFKEGGLYTLANLVTKGISLLLIPFYTTYFSPNDYGVIDILNLFSLFVAAIVGLQLNQGLARYVAEPKLSQFQKKSFASSAIWFTVILMLIATLVLVFIPEPFIDLLSADVKINRTTFIYAVIVTFLNTIFYLLTVHFRFLRKTVEFTLLSFIHAFFSILFILLFVLVYNKGIDSIYLSYLIIVPPLLCVQFYLLRKELVLSINKKSLKKLLIFSAPLIPAAIALMLMNFSDRIYIKKFLDFSQLGIYAMAGKFASIVVIIVSGFGMAIAPMMYEKQYEESTKSQLSKIFKLYISIGTTGVLMLSLYSKEIVHLVTNERFHNSSFVMPILFLTAYFAGFAMFSLGLNIAKKTIITAILVIFFAGLNILLNQLMIPAYALMGAAISTLIATAIFQLASFKISQYYFPFEYPFLKITFISVLHGLLITGIVYWDFNISFVNIFIKLAVIALYVLILFQLKLLSREVIKNFLKSRKS